MFAANGIADYSPPIQRASSTKPLHHSEFISIDKEQYNELTELKYNRDLLIQINEERETNLKSEIRKCEKKNAEMSVQLKKSEELRIRQEEKILALEAKIKELNSSCRKEQEKRHAKNDDFEKAAQLACNSIKKLNETTAENVELQSYLQKATNELEKLKAHTDEFRIEHEHKMKTAEEIGRRLQDRNKQLNELKQEWQKEVNELRENMEREFTAKLAHEQSRNASLRRSLNQKDLELKRLLSMRLRESSGHHEPEKQTPRNTGNFGNFVSPNASSFRELASDPIIAQKRPFGFDSFTNQSLTKRRRSEVGRNFSQFPMCHSRPPSWNDSSLNWPRGYNFELSDTGSVQPRRRSNPEIQQPILIDLTDDKEDQNEVDAADKQGEVNVADQNEVNVAEQSGSNSTEQPIPSIEKNLDNDPLPQTNDTPSEKFEDIYEVIDHTQSPILHQSHQENVATVPEHQCQYVDKVPTPAPQNDLQNNDTSILDAECQRFQDINASILHDATQVDCNFDQLPEGHLDISAEEESRLLS